MITTSISLNTDFNKIKHQDLKKLIFSNLDTNGQRKIYWWNKKLRPLLPESSFNINIKSLKTRSIFPMKERIYGLLELPDGSIAYWTSNGITLMNYNYGNNKFELIRTIKYDFNDYGENIFFNISSLLIERTHVIFCANKFSYVLNKLEVCDTNFNIIQSISNLSEYYINNINSLNILSSFSFVITFKPKELDHIIMRAYQFNTDINKYELLFVRNLNQAISCFVYSPKYDYLICGEEYSGL